MFPAFTCDAASPPNVRCFSGVVKLIHHRATNERGTLHDARPGRWSVACPPGIRSSLSGQVIGLVAQAPHAR